MRTVDVSRRKRPTTVDAGPAPMLQWIRIEHLVVDEAYQRELAAANWKAIERIAAQFRWSRFSPVFVAPIEGGRFAIIDGQHRTHAAAICGMAEVPCQVVQMTPEEQAASFAAVNGLVTKVTLWQIFKAALAAGQPWAVECERICAEAGCRLMTGNRGTDQKRPGQIFTLGMIRRFRERGSGPLVTAALKALRQSETGAEAAAWANELLRPWLEAVTARPWLAGHADAMARFLDDFDVYGAIDQAAENAKRKQRLGFGGGVALRPRRRRDRRSPGRGDPPGWRRGTMILSDPFAAPPPPPASRLHRARERLLSILLTPVAWVVGAILIFASLRGGFGK